MDEILSAFLTTQYKEGMALAAASDLLELFVASSGTPPQRYLARFRCTGLLYVTDGKIVPGNDFSVGLWFPDDYLHRANPAQVVTWLSPRAVWHPNILPPFLCVGRVVPGTSLVDLLYQIFEIITYNKVTMREDDALNKEACAWARHHQDQFPVDTRPLKRRTLALRVETLTLREDT
jgi:hypothetical protein